ncbi:AAA family ATPase [Desulforhopalus sp. IMCC35007]|uniref:AAA family ATPase n=1 Tax=Desulforhopalus sp. IMCC35007 TaxID=2569543 RepID=UPI0010ADAD4D|nr:AAA family ATPase [Desulforhopalus sp. IMCC35007]TKB05716.1 NACHT domain-containing protein [Desulforhopalus sp. IMCC35007]
MTDISIDQDSQVSSPFQEEIDLAHYYAAESVECTLLSINAAIADGVPLIVLSGEEGSGKTMLCHKLNHDPQQNCNTVFFPRTVDSFEDVVRIVALGLGLELQTGDETKSLETVLEEIALSLTKSGQPLLLIFDEAENIYLATLERIRKMLDRIIAAGGRIHVLFAGRKPFLENCEQLSMCEFKNTKEHHVEIEPLSEEETVAYLRHRSSQLTDVDGDTIFTSEVLKKIYQVGRGNFRMTNILAEEAVDKDGDDSSFMVLLESVKDDALEKIDSGIVPLIKKNVAKYRTFLPFIGIGVGVLAVIFLFLQPGPEKNAELGQKPATEQVVAEKIDVSPAQLPPPQFPVEEEKNDVTIEEPVVEPEAEEERPLAEEELEAQPSEIVEEVPVVVVAPKVENQVQSHPQTHFPVEEEKKLVFTATKKKEKIAIVEKELPEADLEVAEKIEVMELLRNAEKKKRPEDLPKTTLATLKAEPVTEVPLKVDAKMQFSIDQLYKKRLMAGASWYRNKKDDMYTVQIMVLTSETAEENLKKMLEEEGYRREAGNFYIFKKLSTSDTLFVFYGEYATIAEARTAQNSLPQFLRDHKPYAISVKGAMAKVKR